MRIRATPAGARGSGDRLRPVGWTPEESLAAALYQVPRIARLRNLDLQALQGLISAHAQGRWLGLLGEPRINVLELNLALDGLATHSGSR